MFYNDGRVFNGEWEKHKMKKGEMSYLQTDGKRINRQEKYDAQSDFKN